MSWFVAIWAGLPALVAAALAVTRPSVVHGLLLLIAALLCLAVAFFLRWRQGLPPPSRS